MPKPVVSSLADPEWNCISKLQVFGNPVQVRFQRGSLRNQATYNIIVLGSSILDIFFHLQGFRHIEYLHRARSFPINKKIVPGFSYGPQNSENFCIGKMESLSQLERM